MLLFWQPQIEGAARVRLGGEGCSQAGWPTISLMRSAIPQHPETKSRVGPVVVTRVSQAQLTRQVCSNEAKPRTSQNIKSASQSQCPNQGGAWPAIGIMSECLGLNLLSWGDQTPTSSAYSYLFPSPAGFRVLQGHQIWVNLNRFFLKAMPLQYRQKHLPQHQKKPNSPPLRRTDPYCILKDSQALMKERPLISHSLRGKKSQKHIFNLSGWF